MCGRDPFYSYNLQVITALESMGLKKTKSGWRDVTGKKRVININGILVLKGSERNKKPKNKNVK